MPSAEDRVRVVGHVVALSRFPVKSTAGESLSIADVGERGFRYDRRWGIYTADGGIASGKTTRRFRKVPGLMTWRSFMSSNVARILAPDGTPYVVGDPPADAALTHAFDQPLALRAESTIRHHDECGVHLVTTASIRRLEQLIDAPFDPARARGNVLIDTVGTGFPEDDWTGATLLIGSAALRLGAGMPRCVMLDGAQAGVSFPAPALKTLGAEHATVLGLKADVLQPGTISLGDAVHLLCPA